MREHYDFSKMKGRKNPYIKYLKQRPHVVIERERLTGDTGRSKVRTPLTPDDTTRGQE